MTTKRYLILTTIMLALTVLTACGIGGQVNPYGTKPTATTQNGMDVGKDKKYEDLFKKDAVLDISITIDPAYLEDMYTLPDSGEYYTSTVKVGDTEITNSGLRIMGNTDLDGGDESASRYSYRIKFDKFVEKQRLFGLDELVLSNASRDPSYMREFFMCEAFSKVGLPAPLATFANVTINGNHAGFYIAIESIDDSFLRRVYGNNDGNLYKSSKDTTLQDLNSLTMLEQKNGKDESKQDIQTLIETLSNMPVGEKGDIEKILDVDSVLKYIAVNSVLGNFDSYIGASCDNYYFVSDNSRLSIVPWDFNLAFGAQKKDNGITVTLSVDSPVYRCDITERPLAFKIFSVTEYYDKYIGYVNTTKEFLSTLETRINETDQVISSYVQNDPSAFYTFENYKNNIGKSEEGASGVISIAEYGKLRLQSLS